LSTSKLDNVLDCHSNIFSGFDGKDKRVDSATTINGKKSINLSDSSSADSSVDQTSNVSVDAVTSGANICANLSHSYAVSSDEGENFSLQA